MKRKTLAKKSPRTSAVVNARSTVGRKAPRSANSGSSRSGKGSKSNLTKSASIQEAQAGGLKAKRATKAIEIEKRVSDKELKNLACCKDSCFKQVDGKQLCEDVKRVAKMNKAERRLFWNHFS